MLKTFFLACTFSVAFLFYTPLTVLLILELSWESIEQTSDFSAHLFFSFLPFHCSFPLCKDQYHMDHYRDSTIALPCKRKHQIPAFIQSTECLCEFVYVFVWTLLLSWWYMMALLPFLCQRRWAKTKRENARRKIIYRFREWKRSTMSSLGAICVSKSKLLVSNNNMNRTIPRHT